MIKRTTNPPLHLLTAFLVHEESELVCPIRAIISLIIHYSQSHTDEMKKRYLHIALCCYMPITLTSETNVLGHAIIGVNWNQSFHLFVGIPENKTVRPIHDPYQDLSSTCGVIVGKCTTAERQQLNSTMRR